MSEDIEESTKFIRQRRDLFVISVILLLIPIANIQITPNVSISQFGIAMTIGKPEIIYYALWALWLYWYLRYFQTYRALNKRYIADKYKDELSTYLYPIYYKISQNRLDSLISDGTLSNVNGGPTFSIKTQNYFLFNSEYTIEFSQYDVNTSGVLATSESFSLKGFRYAAIQLKSLIKCCFTRIEVTEYLFPFLFGLAPLVQWVYTLIKNATY